MASAIALSFSLFLTPVFLRLFRRWGWGQVIRTPDAGNNPQHELKRGTPTMGGVIFVGGTTIAYLIGTYAGGNPPTISGFLVLWMMVGFALVGFIDDYMKLRSQRSLGLSGWRKIVGQVIVIVPWALVALQFPDAQGQTPATAYVSVFRDISVLNFLALPVAIGILLYIAWISFIGVAWSNSTNVTDGLDGLATGVGVFTIGAMSLTTFWQFQQRCDGADLVAAYQQACYQTRDPLWDGDAVPGDGRHRRGLDPLSHRDPHGPHRRGVHHRIGFGHPAADLFQAHPRQTSVPHEPLPPPSRDARVV